VESRAGGVDQVEVAHLLAYIASRRPRVQTPVLLKKEREKRVYVSFL
jgi:hypothetical protein